MQMNSNYLKKWILTFKFLLERVLKAKSVKVRTNNKYTFQNDCKTVQIKACKKPGCYI